MTSSFAFSYAGIDGRQHGGRMGFTYVTGRGLVPGALIEPEPERADKLRVSIVFTDVETTDVGSSPQKPSDWRALCAKTRAT